MSLNLYISSETPKVPVLYDELERTILISGETCSEKALEIFDTIIRELSFSLNRDNAELQIGKNSFFIRIPTTSHTETAQEKKSLLQMQILLIKNALEKKNFVLQEEEPSEETSAKFAQQQKDLIQPRIIKGTLEIIKQELERTKASEELKRKNKFLAAVKSDDSSKLSQVSYNGSSAKEKKLQITITPHNLQHAEQLFDTLDAFGSLTLQEGKWVLSRQTENFDDDLTSITTILETMKTISEELMRKRKFLEAIPHDSAKLPQASYTNSSVKEKKIRIIITPHNLQHAEELFDKLDVLGTLSLQDGKWFWECKTEDFLGDFRAIKTILQGYEIFDRDVRNPHLAASQFPATASD